jgi:5-methylcytosine-specific restriction endonuclease McrA
MERDIKIEKQKAQELRKSRWWHNRCQNAKCYYCMAALTPETATMDHVIPLSQGGKSTKGNVVPACKECNNKKKDMNTIEWMEYLQNLYKS